MPETRHLMREPPKLIDEAKSVNGDAKTVLIEAPELGERGVEPLG